MEYRIGSFNMYKFNYRRDTEISKNMRKLADIIVSEKFDIIGLQEVFNEGVLTHLKGLLGPYWSCVWAQPISKSVQAAEGYAFLWNTRKFTLATGMKKDEKEKATSEQNWRSLKVYNARIYDNYRVDRTIWSGGLVRDPLFARFESVNGWFEVRLINTHIMFSDHSASDGTSLSDAMKRKAELSKLLDIYRQLADRQYRSCRPAYTFLLGDYNLNLARAWTKSPYLEESVETIDRNGVVTKRIVTVQDQLTTLKMPQKSEDEGITRGFANNYDHFSYDEIGFNKRGMKIVNCQKIDTVRKYCDDDFALHRKELSDHVPICLSFTLNE